MATKTRRELGSEISDLCEQANCSEKIKAIHYAQFVDRQWNPHPPRAFVQWWPRGKAICETQTGRAWRHIDEVRAFNSSLVRDIYNRLAHD